MDNTYVTSPTMPSSEGIVKSQKEFSDALTLDLTDEEIGQAFHTIASVHRRYYGKSYDSIEQGVKLVEEMEKEIQTELAEKLHVLCRIDVTPMLVGGDPILEIMGRLPGGAMEKYGLDHEKKEWEVKRATERDEAYLGQKEEPNAAKRKRRARKRAKK